MVSKQSTLFVFIACGVFLISSILYFKPWQIFLNNQHKVVYAPTNKKLVIDNRLFSNADVATMLSDLNLDTLPIVANIYLLNSETDRTDLIPRQVGNPSYFSSDEEQIVSALELHDYETELRFDLYLHEEFTSEHMEYRLNINFLDALFMIGEVVKKNSDDAYQPDYPSAQLRAMSIIEELNQYDEDYFIRF